ncbi:MAG: heparinase II/III family protein [Chitinophagaceae bacterium]|nr:heparinase II/III family protein [Chitinophagaceae bacterium]
MHRILIKFTLLIALGGLQQLRAQEILKPDTRLPSHPRILLLRGEESQITATIASDETWLSMHRSILRECDSMLNRPPVEHVKIGRRLLDKSRECLRRVFFLSYAWRMEHDPKYLARAEKELLAVCAFSDWNPTHFLDVAEMTLAVSIGYDWLYDALNPFSRAGIRQAIVEKGLKPSLEPQYNSWLKASHNWNQVCNGGMSYGALAVYEDEPELARNIINRAVQSVELPMQEYGPDGGYPEGYNYWGYGTSYNVMMLSALEKALGRDLGLKGMDNFLKTARFLENMAGPSHNAFNFFDAGGGEELHPAMFWFAARENDPSLLWMERGRMSAAESRHYLGNTLLPAIMIWGKGIPLKAITAPKETIWVGAGKNPVALMRSSWTDTATFIGFKGGSPSTNHAHMDVGSFVMDAEGVRWAMDFGMQNYESLESKGVDLWNMKQNSQRWQVFRYNNFAHNTLTVNDSLQRVDGKGRISSFSKTPAFMNAIVEMPELYKDQLSAAKRGIALVDHSYVIVRDELETATEATIRWTMATAAVVTVIDDHTINFSKNGKTMQLEVRSPVSVTIKNWPTTPVHDYDAPNPGTSLVGFEFHLPAHASAAIEVLLVPGKAMSTIKQKSLPLANWPK